jgi:hypothetical protein
MNTKNALKNPYKAYITACISTTKPKKKLQIELQHSNLAML